ncbi:MAG: hypothetical protein JWO02_3016 [Solirubrobacterales bacterium]|nr:hypothetical protein [Solirubrobacterales bacterium]
MRLGDGTQDIGQEARTLNATGAEMRRLWAEGITGSAIITTMSDTGERLAGNTVLELGLTVTIEGREPYVTTLRMPIAGSDTSPYDPGRRYTVKVDPQDLHKLTFSA